MRWFGTISRPGFGSWGPEELVKSGPMHRDGILGVLFNHDGCPAAVRTYYEICAERLWY